MEFGTGCSPRGIPGPWIGGGGPEGPGGPPMGGTVPGGRNPDVQRGEGTTVKILLIQVGFILFYSLLHTKKIVQFSLILSSNDP